MAWKQQQFCVCTFCVSMRSVYCIRVNCVLFLLIQCMHGVASAMLTATVTVRFRVSFSYGIRVSGGERGEQKQPGSHFSNTNFGRTLRWYLWSVYSTDLTWKCISVTGLFSDKTFSCQPVRWQDVSTILPYDSSWEWQKHDYTKAVTEEVQQFDIHKLSQSLI